MRGLRDRLAWWLRSLADRVEWHEPECRWVRPDGRRCGYYRGTIGGIHEPAEEGCERPDMHHEFVR